MTDCPTLKQYPVYADPFGIHDHPSQTDEGDSKKLNYVFEMVCFSKSQ
jgi:hypothetical protein